MAGRPLPPPPGARGSPPPPALPAKSASLSQMAGARHQPTQPRDGWQYFAKAKQGNKNEGLKVLWVPPAT